MCGALNCMHDEQMVLHERYSGNFMCDELSMQAGSSGCNDGSLSRSGGGKDSMKEYIVRRLSTLECTRLQGFPDHWVDIGEWIDSKGKKHKDSSSPKYKALGNSIALPFGISF